MSRQERAHVLGRLALSAFELSVTSLRATLEARACPTNLAIHRSHSSASGPNATTPAHRPHHPCPAKQRHDASTAIGERCLVCAMARITIMISRSPSPMPVPSPSTPNTKSNSILQHATSEMRDCCQSRPMADPSIAEPTVVASLCQAGMLAA